MSLDNRILFPDIIITDAYLNDSMSFVADTRLYNDTVTFELPSGSVAQYERDISEYVAIPLGTTPKVYILPTIYSVLSRSNVERYINRNFEEF